MITENEINKLAIEFDINNVLSEMVYDNNTETKIKSMKKNIFKIEGTKLELPISENFTGKRTEEMIQTITLQTYFYISFLLLENVDHFFF